MSEGFDGADPARMAELERVLSSGADAIANVNGQTFNVIGAIRMIWRGQVVEAFESLWRSQHSVRIGAAEDALRNAAEIVRRNMEAQIETSATLAQGGRGGGVGFGIAGGAGGLGGNGDRSPQPIDFEDGWEEEYMEGLIDHEVPVTNQVRLNEILEDMSTRELSGAELDAALDELAEIRGYDNPEEFRAQYDIYVELRAEAKQNSEDPLVLVDEGRYPDYLGSPASLRYGKAVGDVLGVDPIFGALLNPTGGIVGPGNGFYAPHEYDAISHHGSLHDAAGYLFNKHRTGPGYGYLGLDPGSDPASPLTGQRTGIEYWMAHPDLDGPSLSDIGNSVWHGAGWAGNEAASWVGDKATDAANWAWDTGTDAAEWTWNTGSDAANWAWDTGSDAAEWTWDAGNDAADWAWDTGSDAAEWTWDAGNDAADWAWDTTTDAAGSAIDSGIEFGYDTVDAFKGLGDLLW